MADSKFLSDLETVWLLRQTLLDALTQIGDQKNVDLMSEVTPLLHNWNLIDWRHSNQHSREKTSEWLFIKKLGHPLALPYAGPQDAYFPPLVPVVFPELFGGQM